MDTVPKIESWTAGQMAEADFYAACVLHHRAFPKDGRTLEAVMEKKRPVWRGRGNDPASVVPGPLGSADAPRRFAVRDAEGRWLANAATLSREINTPRGPRFVYGLLDVATAPEARGLGLGVHVVRAVFDRVRQHPGSVSLFQTGPAKGFYEKLGARVVTNRFVNSAHPTEPDANPFTDQAVMLYPADADWPAGQVDLLGPGY
ncbi:MAG: GNAT family N-acetyltransferase [Planctomycetota bacterium]